MQIATYINLKAFANIKRFTIEFLIKHFLNKIDSGNYVRESYFSKC